MMGSRVSRVVVPGRGLLVISVLLAAACAGPAKEAAPAAAPPDVVLITVDTLRADRVGGALTPAINAIGARGARFLAARTTVPLTLPAHVSLMTGAIPPATGVRLNGVHRFDDSRPRWRRCSTTPAATRRPSSARSCSTASSASRPGSTRTTIRSRERPGPRSGSKPSARRPPSRIAPIAWLRARQQAGASARRPFFLWAHFYDPHAPYTPPPDALARAGGDAYGGEVAYADAEIGRLLRAVSETGAGRPALVVILGDHGESLGEHGERTHGMLLYDGALRIPLVIAGPGVPEAEHRRPVSIVDVAPTVLRLAGLAVPGGMQGRDLLSGPGAGHEVYAETLYPRTLGWSALTALVEDRWKVIAPEGGGEELYDIANDPAERENAAGRKPEVVQAAVSRIAAIRRAEAAPASAPANAEAQERLRALGYVGWRRRRSTSAGGGGVNPAAQIATWVAFEDALDLLNAGSARDAAREARRPARREPRGAGDRGHVRARAFGAGPAPPGPGDLPKRRADVA